MELKCHFCKKLQEQVGKLICGHQICGACFRNVQSTVEKCYLCILNAAQLSRTNMRIISTSDDPRAMENQDDHNGTEIERSKEKLFCTNDGCDFIGPRAELTPHMEHCKFRLLSDYVTRELESSAASSMENAANTKRQLTILSLSKQVDDLTERLNTVTKKLEKWQRTSGQTDNEVSEKAPEGRKLEIAFVAIIAALLFHWYHINQEPPMPLHEDEAVTSPGSSVTFSFSGIEDLVSKARFNKRDMLVSKQMSMEQYKVKLGIGASLSTTGSEVNLWVSAIISKNDDNDWPVGEVLQLSLEHSDVEKRRSYDFLSTHAGTWKESVRVHKYASSRIGQLMFRQMQVETTKAKKYLRFSCPITYEEALATGYVRDDGATVELSIRI